MKKRISAVVTALLVCLLLLPATVRTAYAKDYDEIVSYAACSSSPPSTGRRWRSCPTARS